jgi:hypothetical protein
MEDADGQYKMQQKKTLQSHAEYYESHLPKILKVKVGYMKKVAVILKRFTGLESGG